jgi:hypothetical protein
VASLAKKRGTGRSEVVRDAIARLDETPSKSLLDDWKEIAGTASGGPKDLATNPKHLKGLGR